MFLYLYAFVIFVVELIQLIYCCLVASVQSFIQLIIKPNKKPLTEEVVLITGAALGLGRELAFEFGRNGAQLILWDIDEDNLRQTVKDVKDLNVKVVSYVCDVSDRNAVKETAQKVFDEVGNVTILVNNAGIISVKPFTTMNEEELRKLMNVNIMAHYWTLQEFLPQMMDMNHGHVVAIASLAAHRAVGRLLPYSVSKYAIRGMMQALRDEVHQLKKNELHTTTVFPTAINTRMISNNFKIRTKSWFSSITEPAEAARQIVDGVQRNYETIFIPASTNYIIRVFGILPTKVQNLIFDFLGYKVKT